MDNCNASVLIMMATFNGEKYLREQIDSICAQSYSNWHLAIQDDGSTDSTVSIIEEYCLRDSRISSLFNETGYHGVFCNFYSLISRFKHTEQNHFDYFMFCDQDDIWYYDKIDTFLRAFEPSERVPTLACADMSVCDQNGNITDRSNNKIYHTDRLTKFNVFFIQRIWGCNVMMNKSLFALVPEIDLSKEYAKTLSHDSLYAKFAAICGKIVFIPKQTMSYRRHEENVTRNTYRKKSVSHIIKRVFELDELARVHSQIYNQSLIAIAMLRHVPLTSEQHDVINEIESCIKNGGMRELVFLHDHHVILGGVIENIGRKLILLSGLHKKYLLKEDMYGYGK